MLNIDIYNKVRLREEDLNVIVQAFLETFSNKEHLWIFGSRVNLNARGGDIDLYIETDETDIESITKKRSKFVGKIWDKLGEQKIDIVLNLKADNLNLPIYQEALTTGVQLI